MRIIIIGGGIIGAACAHALRAHEVTVLDAGGGATQASFGWIGASFHLDAAHSGSGLRGSTRGRACAGTRRCP